MCSSVNMWTLWLFGRALEERLGAPRFILFYLACGLVAGLALIGAIGRQRTRVRQIGAARTGVREIGAPRPRTIAFGDRARRLAAAAVPSGPRPKPEATGTPPSEEAGRVGLVRRLARKGKIGHPPIGLVSPAGAQSPLPALPRRSLFQ